MLPLSASESQGSDCPRVSAQELSQLTGLGKCDEGQPSCRRCLDLGLECEGYRTDKDFDFRDQTEYYSNKARAVSLPSTTTTSSCESTRKQFLLPETPHKIIPMAEQSLSIVDLSLEQKTTIVRDFLRFYLPTTTSLDEFSPSSYILLVQNDGGPGLMSMLALAMAHRSASDRKSSTIEKARYYYRAAFEQLRLEFDLSFGDYKDNLMASVHLLSECGELQVIGSGHRRDSMGLGIERDYYFAWYATSGSRGAEVLYFTTLLKLLSSKRLPGVGLSFPMPSWMRANVEEHDHFYRLLLLFPSILETRRMRNQISVAVAHHSLDSIAVQQTIAEANATRSRLTEWYEDLQRKYSNGLFEPVNIASMQKVNSLGLETTFQEVFSFTTYRQASMLSIYWIGMMILNWDLADVYKLANTHTAQPILSLSAERNYRDSAIESAEMICKSLPFMLEKQLCGWHGHMIAARCLKFVINYLGNADSIVLPQYTWCLRLSQHLREAGIIVDMTDIC